MGEISGEETLMTAIVMSGEIHGNTNLLGRPDSIGEGERVTETLHLLIQLLLRTTSVGRERY